MKAKKLLYILVIALFLLTAAACGGDDYEAETETEVEETETIDAETEEAETDEGEAEDTSDDSAVSVDTAACDAFLADFFVEDDYSSGDDSEDGEDEGEDEEEDGEDGGEAGEDDDEIILVTYQVNGDEISNPQEESVSDDLIALQQDTETQQEVWDYFINFMPAEQRERISEFIIFTDGQENVLAAVDQLSVTPDAWSLEIDIADTDDKAELTYTLLHEYGHIMTLNNTQLTTTGGSCTTYQSDEDCTTEGSYLNQFYQAFWTDIYFEWEAAYADDTLDAFYEQYSDQFLTDYAATEPDEDIAESWLYFIISDPPAGDTIAEQKILFFYDFPELVSLRDEIRSNLCLYLMDEE